MRAARLGVYSRMPSAASTDLPRMRFTTKRAFCAVMRENLLDARASMLLLRSRRRGRGRRGALDLSLAVAGMAVERARGRELAELVTDGVLGDEHGDELPTVVDREREPDHVGRDGRAARPGLHDPLLAGLDHRPHLLQEVEVDEGTFLHRSCHVGLLPSDLVYLDLRRWRMNLSVRLLWRVL